MASGTANRWNKEGDFVIYAGATRSLSTLELVVHRSSINPALSYKMMVISVSAESDQIIQITKEKLPANWRSIHGYTKLQQTGNDWYSCNRSLLLQVPSAVIPQEFNFIINTKHPEFQDRVAISAIEDYFWDSRLIENL